MSVPSWERSLSKTQYLFELYKLNVRLGQIVVGKPKKYRENYGDTLVTNGLDALKFALAANNIFLDANTSEADYNRRRGYLQNALSLVDSICVIGDVFLSLNYHMDGCSRETLEKQQHYLGEQTKKVHDLIKGVLTSDKKVFNGKR